MIRDAHTEIYFSESDMAIGGAMDLPRLPAKTLLDDIAKIVITENAEWYEYPQSHHN